MISVYGRCGRTSILPVTNYMALAEHYRNGNPPSFPYSRLLKRPVCKGQERADILESPNYESPTTLETMLNLKCKVQPWQELPERILR